MSAQISAKEAVLMAEVMSDDKVDFCAKCGNIYLLIRLKHGDDYNDFGDRFCPFCGLLTEEFCIPVKG